MSLFQEAIEQRKLQKEKKLNNKGFKKWAPVKYAGLQVDKPVVFRILSNPNFIRSKVSDAKQVLVSRCVGNEGTYKRVCWKPTNINNKKYIRNANNEITGWQENDSGNNYVDPGWIFNRIYEKVMTNTTVNDSSGSYSRKYQYKDTISFDWIFNNTPTNKTSKQKNFFKPFRAEFVINVIDRMDTWCNINKHSKILSNFVSDYENLDRDGNKRIYTFAHWGIDAEFYYSLFDNIFEKYGSWFDVDIVFSKMHYTQKPKTHTIKTHEDDLDAGTKNLISLGPITDEEKQYELYDLDKLYAYTSHAKLLENFSEKISIVDKELGTHFLEELKTLVKKDEETKTKTSYPKATPQEEVKEQPETQIKVQRNKPVQTTETKTTLTIDNVSKYYPKFDSLDQVNKEAFMKCKPYIQNGNILFDISEDDLSLSVGPCGCENNISMPLGMSYCANCGAKFEDG